MMHLLHFFQGEKPDLPTMATVYLFTFAGSLSCLDLTFPVGLLLLQTVPCLNHIGVFFICPIPPKDSGRNSLVFFVLFFWLSMSYSLY